MPDKILSFFKTLDEKNENSKKLLIKLKSEYERLDVVKGCIPVYNKGIRKCLDLVEKIIKSDEKKVLAERQFFKAFTELLEFTSDEQREELLEKMLNTEVENLEITAGYTEEGWVYVRAPGFLPTEKELWLSADFFKPIYQKLTRLNPEMKHFKEKCVIAIVQNIEKDITIQLRDTDNREHKNLSNMLTRTFLVDDSPYYCDFFYGTLRKDVSSVEAFIIPQSEFLDFMNRLNKGEITPEKLLETTPFDEKMM